MEVLEISREISYSPSSYLPHPCPLNQVVWFVPDCNQGNQAWQREHFLVLSLLRGRAPCKGLSQKGAWCLGKEVGAEAPFLELPWLSDSWKAGSVTRDREGPGTMDRFLSLSVNTSNYSISSEALFSSWHHCNGCLCIDLHGRISQLASRHTEFALWGCFCSSELFRECGRTKISQRGHSPPHTQV